MTLYMTNLILKKTKQAILDEAKQVGRDVGREITRTIPESTVNEASGINVGSQTSPIVEAMQQKSDLKSGKEEVGPKSLDYLQKELKEIQEKERLERLKQQSPYPLTTNPSSSGIQSNFKPPPFSNTKSKRRIGIPFFGPKKAKGTAELDSGKK